MSRRCAVQFLALLLSFASVPLWAQSVLPPLRQPAYVSNGYFAEQLQQNEPKTPQAQSVVKSLRNRSSGTLGYLLVDLMLLKPGQHQLRVDVLNQQGDKAGELPFPEMAPVTAGRLPLYTAAVPIAGRFTEGLWFFKILDQVDHGTWYALATLAITVLEAEPPKNEAQPRRQPGGENE
ncbi:MAG: hypothetical protein HQM04_10535 [Magnetococcales bacterium]|nr:hypothetical protein [Magnetococcales bacterium]MBF0115461.1 hypothetical protein [Magnetococcales bacterium]